MAAKEKNLGHYKGIIEDLKPKQLPTLDKTHQRLIKLHRQIEDLKMDLEAVQFEYDELIESLKDKAEKLDWCWTYKDKKVTRLSYKNELIIAKGKAYVEALIKKKEEEKPTEYNTKVGVRYIDPSPDSIRQIKEHPPKVPDLKQKKPFKIKIKLKKK